MVEQKVILGDCIQIMSEMYPKSIDVVVCSPPYNLGKDYKTYEDKLPRQEYLEWTSKWMQLVKQVLKDNGSFFINIGFTNKDPWLGMDVAAVARKIFVLQNNIAWIKSLFIDDKTFGHFKPVQGGRFINNTFEHIFHFTKDGNVKVNRLGIGVPYNDKLNAERWNNEGGIRCRGNCWFIPYETIVREAETGISESEVETSWLTVSEAAEKSQVNKAIITMAANAGRLINNGKKRRERRIDPVDLARWMEERFMPKNADHPAIFPWKLPEMCIKLHGVKDDMVILDPFLGWGNTLIASKKLGVNGIGIDVDKEYVKEAKSQINSIHI